MKGGADLRRVGKRGDEYSVELEIDCGKEQEGKVTTQMSKLNVISKSKALRYLPFDGLQICWDIRRYWCSFSFKQMQLSTFFGFAQCRNASLLRKAARNALPSDISP